MNSTVRWLTPQWPAPANVKGLATLRSGGVSAGPYAGLNLATHVGDRREDVDRNRALLRASARLPSEPVWLEQVHGTRVWDAATSSNQPPIADAAIARVERKICTIMTADCLPVLFCDTDGKAVGAAHAGWRGLAGGVLDATVAAMSVPAARVIAWLGPAIEPAAFEVGEEVREQFLARTQAHADAFVRNARERWQADIYRLARVELERLGVAGVYGGGFDVFADDARFFSYRREKQTGRMATMIWIE